MCLRYRPSPAGGVRGGQASGSEGEEEREEGETLHWHRSDGWRGNKAAHSPSRELTANQGQIVVHINEVRGEICLKTTSDCLYSNRTGSSL